MTRKKRNIETEKLEIDNCMGCNKDMKGKTPLADFSICEECYAEMLGDWLRNETRLNLPEDIVESIIERRIEFLKWANKVAIDAMSKQMGEK